MTSDRNDAVVSLTLTGVVVWFCAFTGAGLAFILLSDQLVALLVGGAWAMVTVIGYEAVSVFRELASVDELAASPEESNAGEYQRSVLSGRRKDPELDDETTARQRTQRVEEGGPTEAIPSGAEIASEIKKYLSAQAEGETEEGSQLARETALTNAISDAAEAEERLRKVQLLGRLFDIDEEKDLAIVRLFESLIDSQLNDLNVSELTEAIDAKEARQATD